VNKVNVVDVNLYIQSESGFKIEVTKDLFQTEILIPH